MHYSTLLDKEKNNIKGTWKIPGTIIMKGQQSSPLPDKFLSNRKTSQTDVMTSLLMSALI